MRMFEYTSTHRHSRNPGNKTSTDIRSSYTDNESVSPLRLLHSEPLSNRHTCRRSLPHTGSGLFSLYAVMPANLWTGNANRGNLPSCSCVLRETVEAADPWLFLCGFGGTNRWTLWEESRQSWAMPKILPRSSHSGSLKGTDKTRSPIIGPGLWKSIPLLTWGAPPKRFHIPASTRSFWQKKNFNFRTVWTIDFTATIFLLSLSLLLSSFQSPTLDTLLLFYSVKTKQECFLLGLGVEWSSDVNFSILDHSNPIQGVYKTMSLNAVLKVSQAAASNVTKEF